MILCNVPINGLAVLAPLAGITDSSFRRICRQFGAAMVFSEMVSADGIVRNDKHTLEYLKFKAEERPIGIQIFGSDPEIMAEAAKRVETTNPDLIDLNFGCPAKKVVKRGSGAAILKDLGLLRKITSAVTAVASLPVTAKIRSGWCSSQVNAIETAQALEGCGVSAITIHPRSKIQLFKDHSDWEIIRKVKQAVSIPVIGNGDIKNPVDAKKMLTETGCDLIMVGRAALGNPWIFEQINSYLKTKILCDSPISPEDKLKTCLQHIETVVHDKGEYRGIREMRKHLTSYIKGLPHCSAFKASLFRYTEIDQLKEELINFFQKALQESGVENV